MMFKSGFAAVMGVGVGLLCCSALAAAAGDSRDGVRNSITARLDATRYNPGKIGSAILVPVRDQTGITLTISGVPSETSRPIHLYSYLFEGSCEGGESGMKYALTKNVLAQSVNDPEAIGAFQGPVRISQRVPVSFDRLRSTPFAISVRLAPADGNHEIFCGDIPR
ncbi:hypothetical protein [Noviherbaspirillum sedimenti]|uniref:Uncharacterized protein n=1 Tax=Noviherbaspirillum sedimenti TaxID=2320865 RepID=A0A3A3G234_9BURK|nr:hypothetical protein [Noviherbaspirillum sedimenti]RJG02533.1 hypothetical protein D3878_13900 [Noviherbaspirillum sedimenti]